MIDSGVPLVRVADYYGLSVYEMARLVGKSLWRPRADKSSLRAANYKIMEALGVQLVRAYIAQYDGIEEWAAAMMGVHEDYMRDWLRGQPNP